MTALYIHWPFCLSKCPYCDFNSHVLNRIDQFQWLNAYISSISYYAKNFPDIRIESVYFGGGTPSMMEPYVVSDILSCIRDSFDLSENAEITLEANPTSFEQDKFISFRQAGVNRISLGVQSLKDDDLKFLGRNHNAKEAINALVLSGQIFEKMNFDLIYARPRQSVDDWEKELSEAMKYAKGHLSLYQLTIEPETPFYSQFINGVLNLPNDGESEEFYVATKEIMSGYGYDNYEISNYAIDNHWSLHNLAYWKYEDYIGIGAGAHGRITKLDDKTGKLTKYMVKDYTLPKKWLENVTSFGNGIEYKEPLGDKDVAIEITLMGLRLSEGFSLEKINRYCGKSWQNYLCEERVKGFCKDGLLVLGNNILKTTEKGKLVLNSILGEIIR